MIHKCVPPLLASDFIFTFVTRSIRVRNYRHTLFNLYNIT